MWTLFIETIFSLGLFFNAALFVPQIIRLYQKKDSRELSLLTFAGFNVIQFFTILHGHLTHDYLLMIGFGLSFITCGIVTGLIIYYRLIG
jgi:MtN3 and saliva related transmembrane protein